MQNRLRKESMSKMAAMATLREENARTEAMDAELQAVKSEINRERLSLAHTSMGSDQPYNPLYGAERASDSSDDEDDIRGSAAFPDQPMKIKAGWMWKEGHMNKSFKKRWFVLQALSGGSTELLYFKEPPVSNWEIPAGTIRLGMYCTMKKPKNARKGFEHSMRMDIEDEGTKKTKFVLATQTAADLQSWKDAIMRQLTQPIPGARTAGRAYTTGAADDDHSIMEDLRASQFLEKFMAVPSASSHDAMMRDGDAAREEEASLANADQARERMRELASTHGPSFATWTVDGLMDALGISDHSNEGERAVMRRVRDEVMQELGAASAPEKSAEMHETEDLLARCIAILAGQVGPPFLLLTVSKICAMLQKLEGDDGARISMIELRPHKKFIRSTAAEVCASTFTPEEITSAYAECQASLKTQAAVSL